MKANNAAQTPIYVREVVGYENGGAWVRVEGGGLRWPVEVLVTRRETDEAAIIGLRINASLTAPITTGALREIVPGDIVSGSLMRDVLALNSAVIAAQPTEAPGPIAEFAKRYREELIAQPRGAMTRTAAALHIHRTTGNYRRERARELGLLPPAKDSRGSTAG